ncbi:gephyrin-like molybdotransferase Glp [Pleionea sp. CnH1-48]|uniref:molybdopterin molybdotransferase MoeA n=1 Tax=Pleionea sp. CnH1-48 TaxID=2954494 RepID=UPI002096D9C2|nr:gephyrin-like molybdotransferase Glp [Pleionea sp. CnH1-48]MCO7225632.1 molybdopterin molybdotransferase MoeA [Pleionea sp. CnH1-48]
MMDCDVQSGLMPFDQALASLLSKVETISETEDVPLCDALAQVNFQTIVSPINVPSFDHSAMDGYALRCADLEKQSHLTQVGHAYAGKPFDKKLEPGQCVRIMTGAIIPDGADTVVMQENTHKSRELDSSIEFLNQPALGENIRRAGNDFKAGSIILHPGQRLSVADVGLLASLGLSSVVIHRRLKVAVFSTGDELKAPGESLALGEIYDSNRFTTLSLLKKLAIETLDMGILPDDQQEITKALLRASEWADVIITSGGVSVGDADYIKQVLQEHGSLELWKIAMKPGKPFAYGQIGGAHFIGLPGNPVSALVTLHQLAVPMLRKFQGEAYEPEQMLPATTLSDIKKRPGRRDFQRGMMFYDATGELVVRSVGNQNSGVLSSMAKANCFIVLPAAQASLSSGEKVMVQPFSDLLN